MPRSSVFHGVAISEWPGVGTNVQGSYPPALGREQHGMGAIGHAKPAVEVVHVAAHGALCKPEVGCDLLVALSVGEPAEGLLLHVGGRRGAGWPGPGERRALEVVDPRVQAILVERQAPAERRERVQ